MSLCNQWAGFYSDKKHLKLKNEKLNVLKQTGIIEFLDSGCEIDRAHCCTFKL